MKKHILICIFFAFLCANLFAQQEVTLNEIETASAHYLSVYNLERASYGISDISSVSYISRLGKPAIYEVLFHNGNTVLLSGSKACIPVIGCSFSEEGETIVDNDDLPCCLQEMLEVMLMDIEIALSNDTITLYHQSDWDELLSVDFLNKENTRVQHGPLLTSRWGQHQDNSRSDINAYNFFVKKTCNTRNCSAGCDAVAMAQVLYFWKHPWNKGDTTYYDWCNMPDSLYKTNNPRYEIERDAVARLVYDCGVSAKTKYCSDGCASSSDLTYVCNALVGSFQYHWDARHRRRAWWGDKKWKGFIKDDLNNNRPVIYRGQKNWNGHAFVCDGYKDGDLFHFNWGWNGKHNELWFTIDNLTPNGNNYNNWQGAIFEIRPDKYYANYCNVQVNLPVIYAKYAAHGITDFWNHVPPTGRILESCDQMYPAEWRTIPSGESSTYTAFERVVLNPGFTAEEGSNFVASIRECPNCNGTIMLNSGGSQEQEIETEGEEDFLNKNVLTDIFDQDYPNDDILVYPNPTTGEIIIKMNNEVNHGEVRVINGLGITVRTEKINSAITCVNLSELTNGMYYLVITTEEKTVSWKIVKQ